MGIELDMYKIKCNNNNINLNYIATIYDRDIIYRLEELGSSKCNGDSRIIFEIDGNALNENKNLFQKYNSLANYIFDNEDWYECRMYF